MQASLDYLPAKVISIKGERMEADDYLFVLKEFHRLLRRKITPTAYALFCAIEDRAGPGDNKSVPAFVCSACHTTLAADMNVKRITVQRTIPLLVDAGVISIEKNIGETDFIRPIVTSEQRAAYLLKGEGVHPACINLIQATYPLSQIDTSEDDRDMTTCINLIQPPVSKRYTNGTNLKQQEEFKTTKDKSLGEPGSQAEINNILDFPNSTPTDSPPDKASQPQPAHGYEQGPVEPKKVSGRSKAHNQGAEEKEKKPNKDPAFASDPRIAIWRKYALLCHYKYWPYEEERKLIFEKIPNEPEHLARWERLIIKWIDDEHDYKIFNIKGLVKVYVNGWRKQTYASQRGSYQ
jgi:hypothetical protein